MKHKTCVLVITAEQNLHYQIRKPVSQLEDGQTLIPEAKRPPSQLVHDHRPRAMQETLDVLERKREIKEVHPYMGYETP